MSTETIELQALIGEHWLDAVDYSQETVPLSWDKTQFEHCEMLRFRLDGKVYTALENPVDGYRSCMRDLIVSESEMRNVFQPVRVVARHRSTNGDYAADILELVDAITGRTVIEVGTDNTDDYYPWFVAAFHPEAMAINQAKDAEAR